MKYISLLYTWKGRILFYPKDGVSNFLRNLCSLITNLHGFIFPDPENYLHWQSCEKLVSTILVLHILSYCIPITLSMERACKIGGLSNAAPHEQQSWCNFRSINSVWVSETITHAEFRNTSIVPCMGSTSQNYGIQFYIHHTFPFS